jgi:hypothetical protein
MNGLGKAHRARSTTRCGNYGRFKGRAQERQRSDASASRNGWAKLAGGVAVIRTGAATETEMKEEKSRLEMLCMPHVPRLRKALLAPA